MRRRRKRDRTRVLHRGHYHWPGMAYSVAEARQNFARLIRSERGKVIEITWRGEPGAVLLSAGEYLAHTGERPRFIETLTRYEPRFQRQGVPGRPSHRSYGSPTRPPGEV